MNDTAIIGAKCPGCDKISDATLGGILSTDMIRCEHRETIMRADRLELVNALSTPNQTDVMFITMHAVS